MKKTLALLVLLAALPAPAALTITWWPQPVTPNWLVAARDGEIYEIDLNGSRRAWQIPGGGTDWTDTATHPSGLAAGLDGAIWWGQLDEKQIVRFALHSIFATTEFPVPHPPLTPVRSDRPAS